MNGTVFSQNTSVSTCLTPHQIKTRELPLYIFSVVRDSCPCSSQTHKKSVFSHDLCTRVENEIIDRTQENVGRKSSSEGAMFLKRNTVHVGQKKSCSNVPNIQKAVKMNEQST